MKTLVIVESPNKIKKIKEYLGDNYVVVASVGHVKDLAKGGKHGIGIDIENNFRPHYVLLKDKIEVIDNIINASCECNEILLCTDADREGEKISADVADILKSTGKPIFRAVFNEITKYGIEKGIKEKHAIDANMVRAQEARRVLDRIVGFTVSPYLMTAYANNLSAGRVQSVATRLISDRENEIEIFKPEEYWTCGIKLQTQLRETFSAKYDGKIKNKEQSDKLVSFIQENKHFVVSKVVSKQVKEKPPAPLITASLQQVMAKRGWEPEKCMSVAQGLYENGVITYIRTDATSMAEEAITDIRKWIKDNNYDLPKTKNIHATKETAQAAHEAIRPTNINALPDSGYMSGDEKELYSVIWQYAIASQMTPAIWNTLNVKIVNKNDNKIVFKASGKALADRGYLKIFGDVDAGKIEIPNLIEKQELLLDDKSIKADQKYTQPPPRYNDASLLKELEQKQIGRPSTFSEIIKKISNRHYVEKTNNTYKPTELGKQITNCLSELFTFMDYSFTSKIEEELDKIAEGKITHTELLKQFYDIFSKELATAYRNKLGDKVLCKKCNQNMIEREGKFGKFNVCINPACRAIENVKMVA
jgi:DNA topoisomerase-1